MSKQRNQKSNCGRSQSAGRNTNHKNGSNKYRGKQGSKDNDEKRVNADNERESKFVKQFEKDGMRGSASNHPNDITWYARNPELLKASASYPFGAVLGQLLWSRGPQYVQGIMKIAFTPCYGDMLSARARNGIPVGEEKFYPEAINQAGKSNYSFLVHANSRNYNYEYQDLSIVEMAGANVFMAIAHCERAFGYAKTYSEKSIYKPEAYLTAMGFDPDDFRNKLGQIWFDINNLIAQTTQIWIPANKPVLKRWFWLCQNIFADANSNLSQSYIFVPQLFHQYNEVSSSTGGCLEPATYPVGDGTYKTLETNVPHEWEDWRDTIQHMIDRLVNSEDRGIMFGDILNAYGAQNIFAMPSIPADLQFEFTFNPEVLSQIENLTVTSSYCLGLAQNTDGLYPIMGYPVYDAKYITQRVAPSSPILNFHQKETPTPDQIVIATRLMAGGSILVENSWGTKSVVSNESAQSYSKASGTSFVAPISYGSEIVYDIQFVVKSASAPSGWLVKSYPWADGTNDSPWLAFDTQRMIAGDYVAFDWAPFIYYMNDQYVAGMAAGTELGTPGYAYGDFDNYTTLDYFELSKLHQMALMSEFGLPIM